MSTGIIYLAKNTISLKCYVGQTTKTLEIRKAQHLRYTIQDTYKFSNALKKYPVDSWEWSILAEVDVKELNKTEAFFIKDLDTFNNGYNTLNGEEWSTNGNPRKNHNVYEVWHPVHGAVVGTLSELQKKDDCFNAHFSELVKGRRFHLGDYVLLKNKDKYDEIFCRYSFYHPDHGVVVCTTVELCRNYPEHLHNKESDIYGIVARRSQITRGWVLAENKDRYEDLVDRSKPLTLQHPEHGVLTMKKSQWKKDFGLYDSGMTYLVKGRHKTIKGWSLPDTQKKADGTNGLYITT